MVSLNFNMTKELSCSLCANHDEHGFILAHHCHTYGLSLTYLLLHHQRAVVELPANDWPIHL